VNSKPKHGGRRPGSGRKKGTPNKATIDLKGKAGEYSEEALQVFVEVMRDNEAPAAVRLQAADKLLDRSHGRPTASVEIQNQGIDPDMMKKLKTLFVDRMALARERQRKVLVERGLLGEDEPY